MGEPATAVSSNTRDSILAAAAQSFAAAGYRATTMQTIAKAAGFTPPTLYAHFGSKRGIFDALVEALLVDLHGVLQRPLPEGLNLTQHLELRVRDMLELAERQRDVFALLIVRPYDLPDVDPDRDDEQLLSLFWEDLFRQHQDELGDRSPNEAALLIQGVLLSWVAAWLRTNEPDLAGRSRRLVELALHGLVP